MAFCNNMAPCGRECGQHDNHTGDCDCHETWCAVCCGLVTRTLARPASNGTRQHEWIQTYTGRAFYPLDPDPAVVVIDDIAHALANLCRFTGHTRGFYSVAQHSVMIALVLPKELALEGLLHDSPEAYLSDVVRPIKYHSSFGFYRETERKVERAVRTAFGLMDVEPDEVKQADKRMLSTERRDLMSACPVGHKWQETHEPYALRIEPWTPEHAKAMFLELARELQPAGPAGELPAWGSLRSDSDCRGQRSMMIDDIEAFAKLHRD